MGTSSWRRGHHLARGLPDRDWGWPQAVFDVPDDWPSAAYLAVIVNEGDPHTSVPPESADARSGQSLFVVRPAALAAHSPILYKVPLATYHAYNASGEGSMYHTASFVPGTSTTVLTTRRPGGGTGGEVSFPEAVDVYDISSPREGVAHWDVPMITWLEDESIAVDYCTDFDLHQDPDVLEGYHLLLSVGHDEYWSLPMREKAQRFVRQGGNIAFFSGNTSWWRIDLADNGDMTCVHPPVSHPLGANWWRTTPENELTGVSYRQGGGWWQGARPPLGYTIQHAGHWAYHGLGLCSGEDFGAEERLVGYECDGAVIERGPGGRLRADGTDGTPPDFTVLGTARLGEGWQDRPAGPAAAAVLGAYTDTGTVLTVGTTDWPRVLRQGNPTVAGVTRNVLTRLSQRGVRVLGPFPARHGRWLLIAGQVATFHVDLGRPLPEGTSFDWTAAVGDEVAEPVLGGITCQFRAPDVADLLTVTVTVHGGDGESSFGWATHPVLSEAEFAQIDVLCRLRDLVIWSAPSLHPTAEIGPGNRPFGDPEWDPLRDGLRHPMTAESFAAVFRQAGELAERARPFSGFDRSGGGGRA